MYNGPVKSGIYCIKNTVTGKVYIGSTARMHRRPQEHFRRLRRGNHESFFLQASFNKHGEATFVFSILEVVSDISQLNEVEQRHIDAHRASERSHGYNSRPTAETNRGWTPRAATIEKLRLANLGKKHSEASKARRSAAMLGVKRSPEFCKATSAGKMGGKRPDIRAWAPEKFAMFKPEQVSQIRADRADGLTYRKLADKYGCSVGTAHFAVNGTGAFYSAI